MTKVGIFIDIANQVALLDSVRKGHRVNYKKFNAFVKERYPNAIFHRIAFGIYFSEDGLRFVNFLNKNGFRTSFTREETTTPTTDRNVKIAMAIFDMTRKLDVVILGTNDIAFVPLIESLNREGIWVEQITPGLDHQAANVNIDLLETDIIEQINTIKGPS